MVEDIRIEYIFMIIFIMISSLNKKIRRIIYCQFEKKNYDAVISRDFVSYFLEWHLAPYQDTARLDFLDQIRSCNTPYSPFKINTYNLNFLFVNGNMLK